MRKILITLAIVAALIVTMSILWIFGGRGLSLFLDRFWTIESAVVPIQRVDWNSGNVASLGINDLQLSLSRPDTRAPQPHIGLTKPGDLALAFEGKVFPFGSGGSGTDEMTEYLAAAPDQGDVATLTIRHSILSWPTQLNFNFMTGHSPSRKRHQYYQLTWKKQDGAKLEMVWRYEQYFYPGDGWTSGLMTQEGTTGLIRVDISAAAARIVTPFAYLFGYRAVYQRFSGEEWW